MATDASKLDEILDILRMQSKKISEIDASITDLPEIRTKLHLLRTVAAPDVVPGSEDEKAAPVEKSKKDKKAKKKKDKKEKKEKKDTDSEDGNSSDSMAEKVTKAKKAKDRKNGLHIKKSDRAKILDESDDEKGDKPSTSSMMGWIESTHCYDPDFFEGTIPKKYFTDMTANEAYKREVALRQTPKARDALLIRMIYDAVIAANDIETLKKVAQSYKEAKG